MCLRRLLATASCGSAQLVRMESQLTRLQVYLLALNALKGGYKNGRLQARSQHSHHPVPEHHQISQLVWACEPLRPAAHSRARHFLLRLRLLPDSLGAFHMIRCQTHRIPYLTPQIQLPRCQGRQHSRGDGPAHNRSSANWRCHIRTHHAVGHVTHQN